MKQTICEKENRKRKLAIKLSHVLCEIEIIIN